MHCLYSLVHFPKGSNFGGTHVRSRTASILAARRASLRLSASPDGSGSDRPPPPGNHHTLSDSGQEEDIVSGQTTGIAHSMDHDARRARLHAVTPRAATASSASPPPTKGFSTARPSVAYNGHHSLQPPPPSAVLAALVAEMKGHLGTDHLDSWLMTIREVFQVEFRKLPVNAAGLLNSKLRFLSSKSVEGVMPSASIRPVIC